jgi:hypothetical protein
LKDKVQSFFERDDNSRTTRGKKQTKTRYKFKKQIRLLSDTIGNFSFTKLSKLVVSIAFNLLRHSTREMVFSQVLQRHVSLSFSDGALIQEGFSLQNKQVTWAQWKTTKVSRDFKSGDKKEINIVGKDDEHGSVGRAV